MLPRPTASTRSCARRSTWARARSCSCAARSTPPRARFGAPGDAVGAVWTRTGRPFFDPTLTAELVDRVRAAAETAGLFDELDTSWLLLDAELLPWSAKAGQLLRDQYAAVGAAAGAALPAAVDVLDAAAASRARRRRPARPHRARAANADAFAAAYRRYCWPTDGLDGVRFAPFQVLAAEGAAYHDASARVAPRPR